MNQATWDAVDNYISDSLVQADPVLESALQASAEAGLPPINVAPNQGKLLHMFAMMCGAKRILEIGTLGGYSSIWLARALPADGKLITLEYEPHHAEVAKANLAKAGLSDKVEVRVGAALASLAQLADEGIEPFDLIFIDADKPNNPHYLAWALKFAHVGTVIIGDNVVRNGAVTNSSDPDPAIQGTRQLFADLASNPKLTATALQTVGSKGYDGFAIAIVQQL
ncbi:O-methyltransferase [Herpetosiphon giganteus]|uniref:O-methyltransferase n=1 Tax=Herpetosiphon giganteus TaxID=2029754 RepID=UPI00195B6E02|nr:O-methyltransferase [Herpetosiphon giganteus]MBM7843327.1 putative O-methyltransferase YrrM [Herpetosiphon giganteus]